MVLTLEIKTAPVPHQSFRVGRNGIKYKPKKIKDYQEYVRKLVIDQLPKGFEPITAGVPITINYLHYCFAYTKSMTKKNRYKGFPKVTKPDLHDNLNKALFDALEGVVFEQDQNIVQISDLRKYYDERDCIKLQITTNENPS